MKMTNLIWEDTVNYRKPALFIGTAYCSFKCGKAYCQNAALEGAAIQDVDAGTVIDRYLSNPLTEAIVFGGLEPLDQMGELADFVALLNLRHVKDDLVIYTGYTEQEAAEKIGFIRRLNRNRDLIVKYGRYLPGKPGRYDEILGVTLVSDNQYAVRYPWEADEDARK